MVFDDRLTRRRPLYEDTHMLSKLEVALLSVPPDMACLLIALGADQAFIWTGVGPRDTAEFFFEMGRRIQRLTIAAEEKEVTRWESR